ncbi:MAG: hypothetical protein ACRDT0_23975 [Pseudonocardiaceae bacterium]
MRRAGFGFLHHRDERGQVVMVQAVRVRAGHIETVLIIGTVTAPARSRMSLSTATCATAPGAAARAGRRDRRTGRGGACPRLELVGRCSAWVAGTNQPTRRPLLVTRPTAPPRPSLRRPFRRCAVPGC